VRAIYQREFGGPDVLEVVEREIPEPPMNHVLVRVRAVGINPVDSYIRSGAPLLGQPPFVLGYDVSGVVESVGTGVGRLRVGEEVHGMTFGGTYAEYVCTPARTLVRKPDGFRSRKLQRSRSPDSRPGRRCRRRRLEAGQRVLTTAPLGSRPPRRPDRQVARRLRDRHSSASKRDFVLGLGADEVIDYRAGDFTEGLPLVDVVLQLVSEARANGTASDR